MTRVHLNTQSSWYADEAASTAKQLQNDQQKLAKDMVSGNMTGQIEDLVDITVDQVGVTLSTPPSPGSLTTISVSYVDVPGPTTDASSSPAPDPAPSQATPVSPAADTSNQLPTLTAKSSNPHPGA